MLELLGSPEKRAEFGENGHRFAVEHFEQNVLFEKILEDRKKLLEK